MSKKDLQRDICKKGGLILSDGTLNLEHLLPKAHDLLRDYNINPSLRKEIRKLFVVRGWENGDDMWTHVYHGRVRIKDDEQASYLWNEDVYNYFNNIAPNGYYFGSLEGDGACIGWFKYHED